MTYYDNEPQRDQLGVPHPWEQSEDKTPEVNYWSTREDDDCLSDDNLDDAIHDYRNQFKLDDELPAEVVVYKFAVAKPKLSGVLAQALEWLDEEYGNPEGDATEPTATMKEAEKVFIAAVLKEYKSWRCDVVDRVTVDLKQWCEENGEKWP